MQSYINIYFGYETGSILTSNNTEDINVTIPSKRIRIPNRKYYSPIPIGINSSHDVSAPSSNLTQASQYHKGYKYIIISFKLNFYIYCKN
jgi:hypothetical protein